MDNNYTDTNSGFFDKWIADGWEWGKPITHECYEKAKQGEWFVLLTPTKPVPRQWFGELKGAKVLGLASGGGQQMPIFTACGAECTVLDYSQSQLLSEQQVSEREGYSINIVRADMTKPLPFADESFDIIFHPVSNSYIEQVEPVWRECYRVLKKGGRLLAGLDNGLGYAFDDDGQKLERCLPFNPLKDPKLYEESIANDWGIQFSHTIEEQVGGQLRAGFTLLDIQGDTDGSSNLHRLNIPTFFLTLAKK